MASIVLYAKLHSNVPVCRRCGREVSGSRILVCEHCPPSDLRPEHMFVRVFNIMTFFGYLPPINLHYMRQTNFVIERV